MIDPDDPSDARFFEGRYAAAGDDLATVPWAVLAPRPALLEWLDGRPGPRPGATALVVACGYGDDAEELARRGWTVHAFDIAPTAIARCRARFPGSPVDYRVADLFDLPPDWAPHDLVVEIQTVQSLHPGLRAAALAAVAAAVAPGGELFLRAHGRDDDAPPGQRPWPVSRAELGALAAAGLVETSFAEVADPGHRPGARAFHAGYRRPAVPAG
jgi:SAM-dependent methyltransferase